VLGTDGINTLAAASHPAFFRGGTLLMSQGDLGGSMFAIVKGTVAVNFVDKDGREKQVATLGPGEVVGEMSMFTGDRRTATVTAQTNVNALEITKTSLEKLFARSPDLLDKFGAILASRQAELNAMSGSAGSRGKEDFIRRAGSFFSHIFRHSAQHG
jgi:CRP-like cAMP-binding protein